jgi:hypothetical protein
MLMDKRGDFEKGHDAARGHGDPSSFIVPKGVQHRSIPPDRMASADARTTWRPNSIRSNERSPLPNRRRKAPAMAMAAALGVISGARRFLKRPGGIPWQIDKLTLGGAGGVFDAWKDSSPMGYVEASVQSNGR